MPERHERWAIVVVDTAPGPVATGPGSLVDRLRELAPPAVTGDPPAVYTAAPDELAALLVAPALGAVVVDLRGPPEGWDRVRPVLLAPAGTYEDDVPLLLVADETSWPRVLDVLHAGRGDGVCLPCADVELQARLHHVAGARRAREAERDHLARAIHDDSLQVLAAVAMRLQLVRRRATTGAGTGEPEEPADLDEAITELGDALERLRTLELDRRGAPATPGRWTTGSGVPALPPPAVTPSLWGSPELLSRLSHDLRSPLNAVLGFAQLLELGDLDEDQADAVRQIVRAGRRLLELINEVVDLSRIEAGHLDLSLEPVDVTDVAREAIDLLRPAAADASVELEAPAGVDLTVSGPVAVMADRHRLLQVLLILLSNAVRYNRPGGHVSVSVSAPGGGLVRVAVRDDGIGIAPERLHDVFVPFDRLGVDKQGVAGSGLGLAIAKGLLARMGGHIDVESAPEAGSTFWFELRAAPAGPSEEEIDAVATATAAGMATGATPFEVLYIEDNPAALHLVQRVLARRPGVTMIPAMQGRLGVQLAVQRQPAMVLVDLHLPDMAGREVVEALASEPATRHIPVVVLSAQAARPMEPEARIQGARAYLTKPFQIDALLSLVDAIRAESEGLLRTGRAGTSTISSSETVAPVTER